MIILKHINIFKALEFKALKRMLEVESINNSLESLQDLYMIKHTYVRMFE